MSSERWERTKEILEQALQLESEKRRDYLDSECRADLDMRREVESLIASHDQAGSQFLRAAAPEVLQLTPSRALTSGARLGPYQILSPLGAGGMGEVYRALDTRLGRNVALKVLPERYSQNPDLRQRLEREARAVSKLSHPNICTLHDIGHQQGVDFLVFEFVEGKTLRQLLASGVLSMRKVIPVAVQIADGLAHAHELGVIHRDLKPENLMVSNETVKILDFGLAKLVLDGEELSESCATALQTELGMVLGTVGYMSPEQASGRALDFRSDQFSFGLVLYELATGTRAFQRKTQAQTLLALVQEEPEPMGSLNPEIPPPFCWVVERCLAKEPEKRYFSTRDLARDLAAIRDRLMDLQHRRPDIRPTNLPIPGSEFIGRNEELAAARELLLRREVRLVTVTGPGGIGKSRLALEVARDAMEQFPSGVYFVPLAGVRDPNAIAIVIAQTLGIRETGGQPQFETLKDYLHNSLNAPMLLLIDNFEHVIAAAPMLAELMAAASNLKLLVTSRAALHIYDEHEFPVPPLALPDAKSLPPLEVLRQFSAISLFTRRALAVKPDFKLSEENATAVVEICSRLDGLPLAIELAAARTKLLSPSAMRTRLASRLQLLTGGARDLPARQQTLRQAIDWSYDLLSPPEQKLFRRLSVFTGGCNLEAVESVCDTRQDLGLDILDGMASMVDKSLARQIEQADGEPRFVLLETIREYGLGKMAESGEEAQTRRAHAAYCLVLAEEGAAEDAGPNQNGWMDRFDLEHDNFRAALEWLTETGNVEWGLRLGVALFQFWEMREYLAEGRERLGKLLKREEASAPTEMRLRALFATGVLAAEQGDYAVADELLEESLEIARRSEDKRSIAVSLNAVAVNARDRDRLAASQALFEESLMLWRDLHDGLAVARALSNLANVVKLQEDYARAHSLYQESLVIFRELGDRTGVAWALNHQGDVARDQGESEAARLLYEESLATFRELNDRWGIAGSLADLGNLAREQKHFREADSSYRESIAIFKALGHKRGIARLLESFACSAAAQSEPERSLRMAGAAAALRQNIGAPLTAAEQAKLEKALELARRGLPTTTGRTAWLEGWVMPIEKAIEDVLKPTSTHEGSHSSTPPAERRLRDN
jgi:predicted ATPase/tRNA A-37 threonylcarbamoyl transferase component Bud32